jgi:hypothetical protein
MEEKWKKTLALGNLPEELRKGVEEHVKKLVVLRKVGKADGEVQ